MILGSVEVIRFSVPSTYYFLLNTQIYTQIQRAFIGFCVKNIVDIACELYHASSNLVLYCMLCVSGFSIIQTGE